MNQVIHILKKDCRRFRFHLLAFGLVLGLLFLRAIDAPDIAQGVELDQTDPYIDLFVRILLVILAALIVVEDPLVGSRAHWRTRPMGRGRLLLAKLTFLLLFLTVAPIGVQLLALWQLGAPGGLLPAVVLASLFELLPMLLLAAALASLCRDLSSFAVAAVLSLAGLPIFANAVNSLRAASDMEWGMSLALLSPLLLTSIAGIAIWHQYLTGATRRSAVLFGIGILATQSLVHLVPSNLHWRLQAAVLGQPQPAYRLELDDTPEVLKKGFSWRPPDGSQLTRLHIPLRAASELPSSLTISSVMSRLRLPGRDLTQWLRDNGVGFGGSLWEEVVLVPVMDLPTEDFERWKAQTVQLQTRAYLRVEQAQELGALPVAAGSRFEDGLRQFEVKEVALREKGLAMTFHQRHLSVDWPFGLAPFIGAEAKRSLGAIQPKLDNSKRPIVMRGTVSGGSGYVRSVILSSCGIAYRKNDTTASLDEEHFWDTTGRLVPWRVDRDWLREARLRLKLQGTVRSAFTQDFELRGIRLSDLTQPAWSDRGWTDASQGSAQNRPQ